MNWLWFWIGVGFVGVATLRLTVPTYAARAVIKYVDPNYKWRRSFGVIAPSIMNFLMAALAFSIAFGGK